MGGIRETYAERNVIENKQQNWDYFKELSHPEMDKCEAVCPCLYVFLKSETKTAVISIKPTAHVII